VIAARVRLHDARVHGKPFALDETHHHRSYDDALENMAQDVAITESVQPILGEHRVVGNRVIEIETGKNEPIKSTKGESLRRLSEQKIELVAQREDLRFEIPWRGG
jgi:hypothetical protein